MIEDLQGAILTAIQQRETASQTLAWLVIHEAEASHAADVGYKRAYRNACLEDPKRTVAFNEAVATLACEELMLEARLAKAKLANVKQEVHRLDSEISAYQSLLALRRAEASAVQFGQYGGA